jgi:predicted secreted acid phosphatase
LLIIDAFLKIWKVFRSPCNRNKSNKIYTRDRIKFPYPNKPKLILKMKKSALKRVRFPGISEDLSIKALANLGISIYT